MHKWSWAESVSWKEAVGKAGEDFPSHIKAKAPSIRSAIIFLSFRSKNQKDQKKTHTTTSINAFTNHPEKSFSTTLVGNDQISLTRISSLITVQAIRRDRKKTKKDFHFVVTSLHPSSVKFAFESSPLRSCLISRLACVVVNWFTMSSAVWLKVFLTPALIPLWVNELTVMQYNVGSFCIVCYVTDRPHLPRLDRFVSLAFHTNPAHRWATPVPVTTLLF